MANPLSLGALLTQGLRSEFSQVYMPRYQGIVARLGEVMWLDATSDKITELYGFLESPIYPVRWDPGNPMPSKGILSTQFRITNRDFGRRVYLPRNWEDDQTGSAWQVARGLGTNWATLSERIGYQYMLGATDNDLLPTVPSSADGSALYITTTRHGSADGNVVAVTSTATVQGVITDIYSVERRFTEFQNTESQPFWDSSDIERGFVIFHGPSTTLVMRQAEKQMVNAIDASTAVSNAGTSNTLIADGSRHRFINSQRITNARHYHFLRGLPNYLRPIVRQVRKGMTEAQGNFATSDHTRDVGESYVQFDSREGWGSALAIGTIRVS